MDERICPDHENGHCWHRSGQDGFRGKWETLRPVTCCHCRATGTMLLHGANHISEFRRADSASGDQI